VQPFDKRVLRAQIAKKYLQGDGIEIGALASPLALPPNARAHYVDRMSRVDLYQEYPEMRDRQLVEVDMLDNGETLECIPDNSVDFIIGNHFMEHCQDFLGTMKTHFGKLLSGGVLFYAVPLRPYTFDRRRANTSFEHLIQDHRVGPHISREAHFLEWARLVEQKPGSEAATRARELQDADYSIHFHAWDARALLNSFTAGIEFLDLPGHVFHFELNGHEAVCVIGRT